MKIAIRIVATLLLAVGLGLISGCPNEPPPPQVPPTADFEVSGHREGLSPLIATFLDTSRAGSSRIIRSEWTFGDNSPVLTRDDSSTGPVTHTYTTTSTTPVSFAVSLKVISEDGSTDEKSVTNCVSVLQNPITTLPVDAGWFFMGAPDDDATPPAEELERHWVSFDGYEIGETEITNKMFADILNWAMAPERDLINNNDPYAYGDVVLKNQPAIVLLGLSQDDFCQIEFKNLKFQPKNDMDDYPVVEVSWYGAACFCNWLSLQMGLTPCYDDNWVLVGPPYPDGFRLPTEAEWERAASWDPSQVGVVRISPPVQGYQWWYAMMANDLTRTDANFESEALMPVDSFADKLSPVKCINMSGNAAEWVYDRYRDTYPTGDAINPAGPTPTPNNRIANTTRGGSYLNRKEDCRSTSRKEVRELYSPEVGFRVVRTPAAE